VPAQKPKEVHELSSKVLPPTTPSTGFSFAASTFPQPSAAVPEKNDKPSNAFSFTASSSSQPTEKTEKSSGFNFTLGSASTLSVPSEKAEKPANFNFKVDAFSQPKTEIPPAFSFSAGLTTVATNKSSFAFNPSAFPQSSSSLSEKPAAFGFLTTPASGFQTSAPKPVDDEGGDDDEEGEPILEPEKILKNENDTDEILVEVPAKLFGFSKAESEWKDLGKGSFRLTKDPANHKKRLLVRNTMGKITLNAAFYKTMKIEQVKGGLKFFAVVAQATDPSKTELRSFMIKFKEADISMVKGMMEDIINKL
jgi:hypothetical protein